MNGDSMLRATWVLAFQLGTMWVGGTVACCSTVWYGMWWSRLLGCGMTWNSTWFGMVNKATHVNGDTLFPRRDKKGLR